MGLIHISYDCYYYYCYLSHKPALWGKKGDPPFFRKENRLLKAKWPAQCLPPAVGRNQTDSKPDLFLLDLCVFPLKRATSPRKRNSKEWQRKKGSKVGIRLKSG